MSWIVKLWSTQGADRRGRLPSAGVGLREQRTGSDRPVNGHRRRPAPVVVSATSNFALVYTDGTIAAGTEQRERLDGATWLRARCPTYAAQVIDRPARKTLLPRAGPSRHSRDARTQDGQGRRVGVRRLTEGYYAVWFAGGGLRAVNLNAVTSRTMTISPYMVAAMYYHDWTTTQVPRSSQSPIE